MRTRIAGVALVALLGACDTLAPSDVVGAVDHVQAVLAEAGHGAPGIRGLVHYACGPADEFFGVRASEEPVTVDVPWEDVAAVLDDTEVQGRGWAVRWAASADAATEVTVVGGGEVTGDALQRWQDAGLVTDVYPCG